MDKIQKQTQFYRSLPLGYYHLCSDGWQKGKLFHTDEQFAFGVAGLAISTIRFDVKIYAYELMPNHFHILLSATGAQCIEIYYSLMRRINKKLKEDGFPGLPEDYWFKLVPVESKDQMRDLLVYMARNKYEKGICTPFGHAWGTSYLIYNQLAKYINGTKVKNMSSKEVMRLVGSHTPLQSDWEIHPVLGVLPKNFVYSDKVLELFPSAKDYVTRTVKQYESMVKIAETIGEDIEWSEPEVLDILYKLSDRMFPGKKLFDLTADEKGRIAVHADNLYHVPSKLLSRQLKLPEYVVNQFLHSKDYGLRRVK